MAPSGGGPDTGTEPAIPAQAREPAIPVQARGTEQPPAERVNKPGELWRIEGSLTAVRAEITQLESLDDSGLRSRVSELERRWRAQLAAVLPDPLLGELHDLFDWLGDVPADPSELRIALAQLSGWLDGLLSGFDAMIREPYE